VPSKSIIVLGASGSVGSATVNSLANEKVTRYGTQPRENVKLFAAVRDPTSSKNAPLIHPNVKLVTADMSKPETLPDAVRDKDVVIIVTPGSEDRGDLAVNAINACKASNVGHLILVSGSTTDNVGTIFADQFQICEKAAKSSGVDYTICRLPFFLDNYLGQSYPILNTGQYYGSLSPTVLHNDILVSDIGDAFAAIALNSSKYRNETLLLAGTPFSEEDLSAALSQGLGRTVSYVQVPPEAVLQSVMSAGFPLWQAKGILELNSFIAAGDPNLTTAPSRLAEVLGREPTSLKQAVMRMFAEKHPVRCFCGAVEFATLGSPVLKLMCHW
jgi:NAD(P)H dehydrogenase (quinone)